MKYMELDDNQTEREINRKLTMVNALGKRNTLAGKTFDDTLSRKSSVSQK